MINVERVLRVGIVHPVLGEITITSPDSDGRVFIKQDNDSLIVDKDLAMVLAREILEIFK